MNRGNETTYVYEASRHWADAVRLGLTLVVLALIPSSACAQEAAPLVEMDAKHSSLLANYCVKCHGPQTQNGEFRTDTLSFQIDNVATADKWQKLLNVLNSGEMPPENEKQPSNSDKTDFLDDLSNVMVAARRALNEQQGLITMRRLNRREYKNTLRELLGVEINVSELPSDTGTGGFDTAGQNLFISANQFEQYQTLGREALEEAFARQAAVAEARMLSSDAKNAFTPVSETYEEQLEAIERGRKQFNIGDNRQVGSVSANGASRVRYECETANDKVAKYIQYTIDARERAEKWKAAVEAAAADPTNAEIVVELRKESGNDALFRRAWDKIPGAPNPRTFGFDKKGENDADLANSSLGENWQKYHEYYLRQPGLNRGAYLGTPTMHPAVMALGFLQLPVPHAWTSGDYVFRVCLAATPDAPPERRFLEVGMHPRNGMVRATFEITGTMEHPQIVELPFTLTRFQADPGDRTLFIREKGAWDNNLEGGRKRSEAVKRNGIGPEVALWIDWMEIERVTNASLEKAPAIAAFGLEAEDKSPTPPAHEVHAAITRFARVAFRGAEPPESYQQRLARIYDTLIQSGSKPSTALKDTLSVVLASPMFLYLAEPAADGKRRPLTSTELASRLAYFLWSAPPDEELLSVDLTRSDVLANQTTRLLDDPRSREFVNGFVFQWMGLDRLDFFEVNRPKFPRFDDSTRLAAKNEVYETFAYILQHNAPLSDLVKADYVIINHLLADFYGIPDVKGDAYRKVSLPSDSPRGGLLGMAAINVMGGNGDNTSPVERGAWVLRRLLDAPPPPAPANVPQIARLAGKVLTTRERLAAHQESAQCASCHRKIDPIGFGLENFDAVGQWRTEDSYQVIDEQGKPVKGANKTWQIDASSTLHKGPSFRDYFELREIIAARSDAFATGFSKALIEYALGRPIGFRDEPLIKHMIDTAQKERLGMRAFILALVSSDEFHTK